MTKAKQQNPMERIVNALVLAYPQTFGGEYGRDFAKDVAQAVVRAYDILRDEQENEI